MPELVNFADTLYGPLAGIDALDFRVLTLAGEATGTRSRPNVEPGPADRQLTLGSMFFEIDEETGFAARSTVTFDPGNSDPRLDLVVVSAAGYEVVKGTPAVFAPGTSTPAFPSESDWAGRVPVLGVFIPQAHTGPIDDDMWAWKGQTPRTRQLAPIVTAGATSNSNAATLFAPTSGWELVQHFDVTEAANNGWDEGGYLIGPMKFWCQDAKPGQVIRITPRFEVEVPSGTLLEECRFTVVSVDEDGQTIINYANRDDDQGVIGWAMRPAEAASTGTAHIHPRVHRPVGGCLFLVRDEDIVHGQGVMLELAFDLAGSVDLEIRGYDDPDNEAQSWMSAEIFDRAPTVHLVTEGQSLNNTPGGFAGENTQFAITLVKALRAAGHEVVVSNIAWSGASIAYRTPGAAAQFNMHCMSYAENWLINFGSGAEFIADEDPVDVLAWQEAHCDLARDNGFDKAFQCTMPASINGVLFPTDANRLAYNVAVRANANGKFDDVIDIGGHPLQQNATIAPYIVTGDPIAVHPNAAGLDIYAEVAVPVLEKYL